MLHSLEEIRSQILHTPPPDLGSIERALGRIQAQIGEAAPPDLGNIERALDRIQTRIGEPRPLDLSKLETALEEIRELIRQAPNLETVESCLRAISEKSDQTAHSAGVLEARLDCLLSKASTALATAFKEVSQVTQLKSVLEDVKLATNEGRVALGEVIGRIRDAAQVLDKTSVTLDNYVSKGGVADAALFNQSVTGLVSHVDGFNTAVDGIQEAVRGLEPLLHLQEASDRFAQGAVLVRDGGHKTLEVIETFKAAGTDLGQAIARNEATLLGVDATLSRTADRIDGLVEIVAMTSHAVASLELAIVRMSGHRGPAGEPS